MPIKPENRNRYPRDWKAIRMAVLERAGGCCEGSPAYPDCRAKNGAPHPVTGSRVVLTVAHLDHTPETRELAQLRAWCQRCHLTYDAPIHVANARRTRAKRRRVVSSFTYHREFCGHTIHVVEDALPGGYDREALCGKRTVLIGTPDRPEARLCRRCEMKVAALVAKAEAPEEPSLFG